MKRAINWIKWVIVGHHRPHIVQFHGGYYAVRKRTFIGWQYFDRTDNFWWIALDAVGHYCVVDTLEDAHALLERAVNDPRFRGPDYGTPIGI